MRYLLSPLAVVPVEVVEEIFYGLHGEAARDHSALNPLAASYSPPSPRTLFPYNVAGVCREWRAIARRTPSFWRRLNISVAGATLADVQQHLLLSGTLDISVVIHNAASVCNTSESERSAISGILRVLEPHLYRCRELQIVVNNGSSLPLFSGLQGISSKLQILVLRCLIDDGLAMFPEGVQGPLQVAPHLNIEPLLIYLSGHTILDTFQHHIHELQRPGTRVIALDNFDGSRYAPDVGESLLPGLLEVLSASRTPGPDYDVSEYDISDDGMESSEDTYDWSPMYQISNFRLSVGGANQPVHGLSEGVMLSMHELDEGALRLITQNLDLTEARVEIADSDISTTGFVGHPMNFWATRLTGDFSGILNGWEGETVTFVDCDNVDDEVLALLGPSRHSGLWDDLNSLTIVNCPRVSVQGIRELVNDRTRSFNEITGQPYMCLSELVVEHAEPLNVETSEWFTNRVGKLRWYTEQMDEEDAYGYYRECWL